MNTDEALLFLKSHQPMPDDDIITDDEADRFAITLEHFEIFPDPRCIPLLVGCVSKSTKMDIYDHIVHVLLAHEKEDVVPHLKRGLLHGNPGVKYRACWWAAHLNAWELADLIRPLTDHVDEDIQDAAENFIAISEEAYGPE